MNAEIISVGDELTSGQRLDTNSQFISRRLGDLGIQVRYHTTVGDDLQDNINAFKIASQRSDVVIITGGLGPTADDLTREAMAKAFERPLEFRPEAMDHIENLFKTRNKQMPERNRVQALFPESSEIIPNPHGTAPGIDLEVKTDSPSGQPSHCRLFALPGVPAEMTQMLTQTVEPCLIRDLGLGKQQWFYHSIKLFGIGESDVEQIIPDLIQRDRIPRVGITVSKATITLRIAALADNLDQFRTTIEPTVNKIFSAFGDVIFAEGELELNDVVLSLLHLRKKTLSVLEIGSGCWIGQLLSENLKPNSSSGLKHLEWIPTIDGPETQEQLIELAIDRLGRTRADYSLAVGYYPPSNSFAKQGSLPSTEFNVVIAHSKNQVDVKSQIVSGHPELFYQRLAKTALDTLRRKIISD